MNPRGLLLPLLLAMTGFLGAQDLDAAEQRAKQVLADQVRITETLRGTQSNVFHTRFDDVGAIERNAQEAGQLWAELAKKIQPADAREKAERVRGLLRSILNSCKEAAGLFRERSNQPQIQASILAKSAISEAELAVDVPIARPPVALPASRRTTPEDVQGVIAEIEALRAQLQAAKTMVSDLTTMTATSAANAHGALVTCAAAIGALTESAKQTRDAALKSESKSDKTLWLALIAAAASIIAPALSAFINRKR